jgi:cell filamentation protein
MGYLAYAHPFLDGNGRTILTVHVVLAERAGISVDWASTNKTEYLAALTLELDRPGKGCLDAYLKPFVGSALGLDRLSHNVARAPGLGGDPKDPESGNEVLGSFGDSSLRDRYCDQQKRRGENG